MPDYHVGYLKGAYKGDGHFVRETDGKLKTATIRVCDKNFSEAIYNACQQAFDHSLKMREAVITKTKKTQYQYNWFPRQYVGILYDQPTNKEQRRGFVAGFYDAEGWCTYGEVKMAQVKKAPLELIGSILDEFKIDFRLREQNRPGTLVPISWLLTVWTTSRSDFFQIFEPKKGR